MNSMHGVILDLLSARQFTLCQGAIAYWISYIEHE
jgi:hypothetical protein